MKYKTKINIVCTTMGSKYLKQAIKSVLEQDYNNFILTIVDDSGTFLSKKTVDSFDDDRIQLILNESNLGQAKSLNIGINSIESDFVSIIDDDDFWTVKTKLSKQLKFLVNNSSCDLVSDRKIIVNESNNKILNDGNNEFYGKVESLEQLTTKNPINHSSVMFRRKVFIELGCYDNLLHRAQDLDLWLRFYLNNPNSLFIRKDITLNYRVFSSKIKILKLYKDHIALIKINKKYDFKHKPSNMFVVFILKRVFNYFNRTKCLN